MQNLLKIFGILILGVVMITGIHVPAHAKKDSSVIIRDTEIENTLKDWMAPLLKAAGMSEKSVNIVLVQSPEINAFVAGGANIFIYTGLIDETENPGELIGVLAHELGHITGGHLIRSRDAMERASYESILGTVLGIGAAIMTGNGGAANAIISGSSTIAARRYLANSRVNESSADQAALTFMDSAQINPQGLPSFLEKLGSSELLPESQQNEYVRTHPISSNRIDALERRISQSPYKNVSYPQKWLDDHARMKAKLLGFISPERVQWVYNDRNNSIPARYARAITAYRENNTGQAITLIDDLLKSEPDNPYFYELKGQMLLDFGRVRECLPYYKEAAARVPDSGLIRMSYGHALLESGQEQQAINELERALQDEPRSARVHRLLATAYGRLGQEGEASLHLAEEAALHRKLPQAKIQAQKALKSLPENSRGWLKARDLMAQIDQIEARSE